MKIAKSIGLIDIVETTSDNELVQIAEMGARHFIVTPFRKLIDLGKPTQIPETDSFVSPIRVNIRTSRVETVTTDIEYRGVWATPGEQYRTVLGVCTEAPTAAAAVLAPLLSSNAGIRSRFRAIVKYDQFRKAWAVVAIDVGPIDDGKWPSSNVR